MSGDVKSSMLTASGEGWLAMGPAVLSSAALLREAYISAGGRWSRPARRCESHPETHSRSSRHFQRRSARGQTAIFARRDYGRPWWSARTAAPTECSPYPSRRRGRTFGTSGNPRTGLDPSSSASGAVSEATSASRFFGRSPRIEPYARHGTGREFLALRPVLARQM